MNFFKKDRNASNEGSEPSENDDEKSVGPSEATVRATTGEDETPEQQLDPIHSEKESEAIGLVASLRELREEFRQVKIALDTEKTIAKDISAFMKEILPQVGKSYELDPALFPRLGQGVKQMTLTPQGIFFLTYQDGLKAARTMDNVSPESLMKVLEEILPTMMAHFKEKREVIAVRSIGLYRIAAEIKEMSLNPITTAQRSTPQQNSAVQQIER